ncbi:plasmid pRiA4b ORF-3 family protein [Salipiger mucosus]|uniref:Mobile element protein n=1 Tax=Salipiger mucosus DSM 16094 TaxID=1123237 RepID=S9RR36_9RHOB|nr:plasmid pRiA4b ORF-3 family protein [Salipiger mucosus]EPX76454.1 Mobile element protein [Salipiger mucosus DSM 16094]
MTQIARLRITLNDVEPQVVRQIEVPLKIRLDRLHEAVQAAMGWTDSHLYEFRAEGIGWGEPDPEGFFDGPLPAKKTTLQDVMTDTGSRTLQYIYDYGDDWDHVIRIERFDDDAADTSYPRLLKATGACPPEDVGGAWGYEEFLEAIAEPDHEQHDDMIRWAGGPFDPNDPRIDRIEHRLALLAKKWAPRARKPKAPGT